MSAGSVIIDLLFRTGSFSTDTERAAKDLAKLKKEAYDTGKQFGDTVKNIAGALGITLSVAGLVSVVRGAIDAADHLNDLSKMSGVAVETLGGIGFAAKQAGGDLESATDAIGKLNKSIAAARAGDKNAMKAFQVAGVDDLIKSGAAVEDVLAALADKFADFEDSPEAAALAIAIFGKAGASIIPLLKDGSEALRTNIAYFKRYSGVTAETAQKADQFNDTMEKLHLLSGAFGNAIASELLGPMQNVADLFLKQKENGDQFKGVAAQIAGGIKGLITLTAFFTLTLEASGDMIGAFAGKVAILIDAFDKAQNNRGMLDIFGSGAAVSALREALPQLKAIDDAQKEHLAQTRKNFADFRAAINSGAAPAPLPTTGDFARLDRQTKTKAGSLTDDSKAEQELKARLEGRVKLIQEFAQKQAEAYQFANKYVDEAHAQGLISLQDDIDAQKRLRDANLAAQVKAMDEEIAARQAAAKKLTGTNQIDEENKIREAVVKRADAVQKAGQEDILAAQKSVAALKQVRDSYSELQAKILDLKGDSAGAARIRDAKAIEDARKVITDASGDPTLGNQYAYLVERTTDLKALQADYNDLLEKARTTEEKILLDAQANGESELDTLKKVGDARADSLKQLGALADRAADLAKTLGTPEAMQFAAQLANGFKKATLEADPLLLKIRDIAKEAGDSIANAFEDAILQGRGLRDILKGLSSDLTRILFRKVVTEPLAKSLTDSLGGTGKSGGLLGDLFGFGKDKKPGAKPGADGVSSLDDASSAASFSLSSLKVDGIEPTIAALQHLQEVLNALPQPSVPGGVPSVPGEADASTSTVSLTTGDFARSDRETMPSGEQSIADLFKQTDDAQAENARSSAALSKSNDAAATSALRLAQAAANGGNALSLLPSIIQLIQATAGTSGAAGGGGGLLGGLFGLFKGGGGTVTTGTGMEGMSSEELSYFFHDGGVVGKDLVSKTDGGPLKPDERTAVLQVGEEVLTKDDPRHRDNIGKARRFHDGGIVGTAVANVYRKGAPPPSWSAPAAPRDDRASKRPIVINQSFPPGTTRATTDQAAASAGAAVRRATARTR